MSLIKAGGVPHTQQNQSLKNQDVQMKSNYHTNTKQLSSSRKTNTNNEAIIMYDY